MKKEMLKSYPFDRSSPDRWIIPGLFKQGVSLIVAPRATGKASLAVWLAVKNAGGKALWSGGPVGDKRLSFFYGGNGCFEHSRICQKIVAMGGDESQVYIIKPGYRSLSIHGAGNKINDFFNKVRPEWERQEQEFEKNAIKTDWGGGKSVLIGGPDSFNQQNDIFFPLVKKFYPALVFFDFQDMFGKNPTADKISDFSKSVKNIDTAFVGFASGPPEADLRGVLPILSLLKRDDYLYLGKKSGFQHSPRGVLKFRFESLPIPKKYLAVETKMFVPAINEVSFVDSTLSDLRLRGGKGRFANNEDKFRLLLDKAIKESGLVRTAEIKALARKAGLSTYFLQNMRWEDYGYTPKGQGFAGDYRQVLIPLKKH